MGSYKFKSRREFNCISPPQMKLYQLLIKIFPDAEMEYKIGGRKNKTGYRVRFADIAIPSLKIDFEYDGQYSHGNRSFSDEIRDEELINQGWRTIRITKDILHILEMNQYSSKFTTKKDFLKMIQYIKEGENGAGNI